MIKYQLLRLISLSLCQSRQSNQNACRTNIRFGNA